MFKPWAVFESAWDITPEFLHKHGLKTVLLDIDNTLSPHCAAKPFPEVAAWLAKLKTDEIKVILVSNNHPPRIKPFAARLELNFIADSKKPLGVGYNKALRETGTDRREAVAIGDQIFTDILGGNLAGIKTIFVFPKVPETSAPFRFKRFIERPLLPSKGRIGKSPKNSHL
ncbi:MAG: YqeG family HAD IIIA-type phosphatase [Ruminococcus sp.]|jgi:HAD superfamily phosphatase (TIGR01668 family)|nr:YqeG family HAD IIIA-type phosphatase [Ruminococcus sp.]